MRYSDEDKQKDFLEVMSGLGETIHTVSQLIFFFSNVEGYEQEAKYLEGFIRGLAQMKDKVKSEYVQSPLFSDPLEDEELAEEIKSDEKADKEHEKEVKIREKLREKELKKYDKTMVGGPGVMKMTPANMNLKSLLALADELDTAGLETEANEIDELIKQAVQAQEQEVKEVLSATEPKHTDEATTAFESLAKIADKLDAIGAAESAELVDTFLSQYGNKIKNAEDKASDNLYDSKKHHSLQVREPKRDQERVDHEGRGDKHHVSTQESTGVAALSTRYCPEHVGIQLGRIGENIYQCSLDGQVYNWETGWTDQDGKKHPGSSVSAQTPNSNDYVTPHRLFDSRDKISKK